MLPYDHTDPTSIEDYAKKLEGKSLREALGKGVEQKYKGKGKLGQLLEELYFLYAPNSNSEPDFVEAGVELKTNPIRKTARGLRSKERLVFNIIDYKKEPDRTFLESSFWHKNKLILLMMYLYEHEKLELDYVFKIIKLFKFPEEDLKIIKDDWEKIIAKIREGRAHELSEGDTLYLGACTKGASKQSLRDQYIGSTKAMQRAFSLKPKYLNFIISQSFGDAEYVIKSKKDYKTPQQTFEELVVDKFKPYYGMTTAEIAKKLGVELSNAKNRSDLLCRAILGVKARKIAEFEKADVQMKTIKLEKSGALKESMSFKQIKYKEIIGEDWEGSYWYETLTKRFFFIVFQHTDVGLTLKKVMFWAMPSSDIKIAEQFWLDTQEKIRNDDYKHFIKISDDMICHVRPKGKNSRDLMDAPNGRKEKKKSYWLNAAYIRALLPKD